MGCRGSKSKKSAFARVAQYQKESWALEKAVCRNPDVLEWPVAPPGCITVHNLHNLLTDGFYAPYAANPRYLLLADCRGPRAFTRRHLATARWHGALHFDDDPPESYCSIVLYDDQPRTQAPQPTDTDPLAVLFHKLKARKLDPQVLMGGWSTIEATCSYLLEGGEDPHTPRPTTPWFPALLVPGLLYLGHAEMAADPRVLSALGVTHVVAVSDTIPPHVFPNMNYLVVPVPEEEPVTITDRSSNGRNRKGEKMSNGDIGGGRGGGGGGGGDGGGGGGGGGGTDLITSLPTIMAFLEEARRYGGRVLVHCDQGLNRAAAVAMGILMSERVCTLEDAFYYVKGARTAVHPDHALLTQLSRHEASLFGATLTYAEDLF